MGWHLGGHHVAVHATVVGETLAVTPSFLGANPAVVRTGPMAGLQVLREEESLARDLLAALSRDQRAVAVVSQTAPEDIATRHDPVADPDVMPAACGTTRWTGPRPSDSKRWCGGTSGGPRRRWPSRRGRRWPRPVWVR